MNLLYEISIKMGKRKNLQYLPYHLPSPSPYSLTQPAIKEKKINKMNKNVYLID
jgi:hypothetical protein